MDILDKGKLELMEVMGNDAAVVEAARVSIGSAGKKIRTDRGLIRYLMRSHHSTPFEMGELKFYVKLPVFVERQWRTHRTAKYSNFNEESARYSVVKEEFYIPSLERLKQQAEYNKQGSSELQVDNPQEALDIITDYSAILYNQYKYLIEDCLLSRELARIVLSENRYTAMIFKIDLHNLFNFLFLRKDSHAQWEIQQYAHAIGDVVREKFPLCYEAFVDYRFEAVTFSRMEMELLRRLITVGSVEQLEDEQYENEIPEEKALVANTVYQYHPEVGYQDFGRSILEKDMEKLEMSKSEIAELFEKFKSREV